MQSISIVIPVYNTPQEDLSRCVNSALAQKGDFDIEAILVDDGSEDETAVFCDKLAEDEGVIVAHKLNAGLSAARNTGFRLASGDWLMFLDADDWIEPDTCESLFRDDLTAQCDVVIFGTIQDLPKYSREFRIDLHRDTLYSNRDDLVQMIVNPEANIATAWAKIYKTSFLVENKLEHDESLRRGSEGVEFCVRVFSRAERVSFVPGNYYHYVFREDSISAEFSEQTYNYVIASLEQIRSDLIEEDLYNEEIKHLLNKRVLHAIVSLAITRYFSPRNKMKYRDAKECYAETISHSVESEALNDLAHTNLSKSRYVICWLSKMHIYFPLAICGVLRYLQKH